MNDRFSPGTAIVGFVFIVLGMLFLLDEYDVIRLPAVVVIPILLIGLGVGLLISARVPLRRAKHAE